MAIIPERDVREYPRQMNLMTEAAANVQISNEV